MWRWLPLSVRFVVYLRATCGLLLLLRGLAGRVAASGLSPVRIHGHHGS
jgi:hypothetical protein